MVDSTDYKCSLFCSFYKGEQFIEGYMENVLEQSIFKDIEFIFLDCNSPEDEKSYILPLIDKYKNIKYFKLDKDPGLYAAWNHAVGLCSADIIGNWNIDDRKNSDGLEQLVNTLYKTNVDIAYGLTYISRKPNEKYIDNNLLEPYPCLPHSFQNLLRNNSPHCMPVWKKELHDKYGFFDTSYKTASDGDFWLRCSLGGATIKRIDTPVGLYFWNPKGRSSNPETLQEMLQEVNIMRSKYRI